MSGLGRTGAAQLVGTRVELEILSEFEGLRDSYRAYIVSTGYPTVFNVSTMLLRSLNRTPMMGAAAKA